MQVYTKMNGHLEIRFALLILDLITSSEADKVLSGIK